MLLEPLYYVPVLPNYCITTVYSRIMYHTSPILLSRGFESNNVTPQLLSQRYVRLIDQVCPHALNSLKYRSLPGGGKNRLPLAS